MRIFSLLGDIALLIFPFQIAFVFLELLVNYKNDKSFSGLKIAPTNKYDCNSLTKHPNNLLV